MENYTEYINDYFAGSLNPEERKNFEKQMEQNKNFAEEVAFFLAAKHALKEELADEKKEWFRQLASQNVTLSVKTRSAPVRKMWVYRLAAAAVFVGVVFFSWSLFFHTSTSPNQMADKYISTHLEDLGVNMGLTVKESIEEGKRLYNLKQYDSALQVFEEIIQRDASNSDAKTNAGLTCLRLGNYDKALMYFQQLEKYTLYANPAKFYQALTLMKRNQPGDKEQARRLLNDVIEQHLDKEQDAQQLLNKKW